MWSTSLFAMNGVSTTTMFTPAAVVSDQILLANSTSSSSSSSSASSSPSIFDSFCEHLEIIGGAYNVAHGYASLTVCLLGTLANILNLIVLTRKEMINSTNVILTGLAFADLLTTVEYVPYAIYTDFLPDPKTGQRRKTYLWALYVLIHSNFSQVCHTIAIWLTVTVAVWRYVMISMPLQCKTLCSMERAKWVLLMAYVMSPLLCVPIYLAFSIKTVTPSDPVIEPINVAVILHHHYSFSDSENFTTTLFSTPPENLKYIVNLSDLAKNNKIIVTINFWVYSVVIKIIPCILLTVVSLRLIRSLMKVKKRKKLLLHRLPPSSSTRHANNNMSRSTAHDNRQQPHCQHHTHPNSCPPDPHSELVVVTDHVSSISLTAATISSHIAHHRPSVQSNVGLATTSTAAAAETSFSIAIVPPEDQEAETGRNVTGSNIGGGGGGGSSNSRYSSSSGEVCLTRRTTIMLLTVLILFLITEFPQGILALFSDLMGDDFFNRCYIPMANLMDFLALFNAALNFPLYLATSIRFRNTFLRMMNNWRRRRCCCCCCCHTI